MTVRTSFLTLLLCRSAGAQAVATPTFVDGDLSTISCRIAKRVGGDDRALLLVDVQNRGADAFEPITFRLALPKSGRRDAAMDIELHRAPLPHIDRVGDRIVPVEFEFRSVFGREWGPEKIRLTDVRIE